MALIVVEDKIMVDKETTILELMERDGYRCMYPIGPDELCPDPFDETEDGRHSITIDHIYPQAKAKSDGWSFEEIWDLSNLQLMGKRCNARKADLIYLDDGTLPPKGGRERRLKLPRPETCDLCMNGRLLFRDEICELCGSEAQPKQWPKYLQREPKECDHSTYHCWMCVVGHIQRVPAVSRLAFGP
jgi:hypothetical protein